MVQTSSSSMKTAIAVTTVCTQVAMRVVYEMDLTSGFWQTTYVRSVDMEERIYYYL